MNALSAAAVGDIRPVRKCFFISGSLLLMLLLSATQAGAAATAGADKESSAELESFNVGDDYADVDNVEWHHVKMVDGIMHEDHPVIMYKEDFVSEDYDPAQNRKHKVSATNATRPLRRYKDIAHHRRRVNQTAEQYRALKPEKMYFDVLPQTPLVVGDDSATNDSKFDASQIRAELIPLVDSAEASADASAEPSKESLRKRTKKYRKRTRRDTSEHVVQKRNPYYRQDIVINSLPNIFKFYHDIAQAQQQLLINQHQQSTQHIKHAVPGKFWNALNSPVLIETPPIVATGDDDSSTKPDQPMQFDDRFGGPNEADRVVWPSVGRRPAASVTRPPNIATRPTRRTPPPLFHDADPNHADFSFMTQRPPNARRPATTTPSPISNRTPSRIDSSASLATNSITASASAVAPENEVVVSQCVWAIVNCCSSRDSDVRYHCFENLGCTGAFWDLNPCADNVRDSFINYVAAMYE